MPFIDCGKNLSALQRRLYCKENTAVASINVTMGVEGSKQIQHIQGPIVEVMRKKHGNSSLVCLSTWTDKFGFPTLNKVELNALRGKLEEVKKGMGKKIKVSVSDLEAIETH